jgi:hypothetical protein
MAITIPGGITIDKSAPTLIDISGSANGITVTWSLNTGVDNYRVFRKTANTKWTAVADVAGIIYTDCNVVEGVEYIYTVRGIDEQGKYVTEYNATGIAMSIPGVE